MSHVAPDILWVWDIYRAVIMIFENTVMSKASVSLQIPSRRLYFADISSAHHGNCWNAGHCWDSQKGYFDHYWL